MDALAQDRPSSSAVPPPDPGLEEDKTIPEQCHYPFKSSSLLSQAWVASKHHGTPQPALKITICQVWQLLVSSSRRCGAGARPARGFPTNPALQKACEEQSHPPTRGPATWCEKVWPERGIAEVGEGQLSALRHPTLSPPRSTHQSGRRLKIRGLGTLCPLSHGFGMGWAQQPHATGLLEWAPVGLDNQPSEQGGSSTPNPSSIPAP